MVVSQRGRGLCFPCQIGCSGSRGIKSCSLELRWCHFQSATRKRAKHQALLTFTPSHFITRMLMTLTRDAAYGGVAKSLWNLGRAAYHRELGSGPMNGCDSYHGLPSRGEVDQTVPVTGRRELLGGGGAHSTLSTRRAGSGGSVTSYPCPLSL